MQHITVLLHEAVDGLEVQPDAIVVDATFGSGGHAQAILEQLSEKGRYIGIDADKTALDTKKVQKTAAKVDLVCDNFGNLPQILDSLGVDEVDAVLADLGWRTEQFADGQKGFSFSHDGPLHMTFGEPKNYSFTARDIINDWEEHVLADIFYGYAEERFSRRISKAIVEARKAEPIETTFQLVEIVKSAYPKPALRNKSINPATKVFQALRIAVNEELPILERFITAAFAALKPGGKLAIISFHSIEDRIVKHSFRELAQADHATIHPKKPIVPTQEEVKQNPRARSAKLRILTKN